MGDWVPMGTGKKRTLTGFFIRYICIFCINTILLVLIMLLTFNGLVNAGMILPANYMETWINDNGKVLVNAERVTEEMLPQGSVYGVYDTSQGFLYGSFDEKEQIRAWKAYLDNNTFAVGGGYYRFLLREDGEVCVVKYFIRSQASNVFLRKHLPSPDICIVLCFIALFVLQTALVSRRFAKSLSGRLKALNEVTEKIRRQDLEIREEHCDIREIDEALVSLSRMGEALSAALEEQWKTERHKREQVAALAHDIKTPLTVIKGNAELLEEETLEGSSREYSRYIRENAEEIERYLLLLQEMLLSEEEEEESVTISAGELAERLTDRARVLAEGYFGGCRKIEIRMQRELSGRLLCDPGQIRRAWDNIVSNALEYTPKGESILVTAEYVEETETEAEKGNARGYLSVSVTDRGGGFTEEELLHAAEQFFQGDKSRHRKGHRGLGLYTASRFAELQGGRVVIENAGERGYGGRVALILKLDKDQV